ncbi:MAG: helix-turn-helix transcriptional regulator [Paludibacteraceae bacterium]|nr:helix-turn-helix transcriptional regulator [Paludibacteraceae bacterium]
MSENMDSLAERIKLLIQSESLNAKQFAEKIGMNQTAISHLLSGRNKPSLDSINGIKLAFPNLNTDWLLFGQLPMYKDNTSDNPLHQPVVEPTEPAEKDLFSDLMETSGPAPVGLHSSKSVNAENTNVTPENLASENRTETKLSATSPEYSNQKLEDDAHPTTVIREIVKEVSVRKIKRIIVYYDDNTYEDFQQLT